MRISPQAQKTRVFPVRPLLLGIVSVAFAMVGLALLAEAMSSDGGTVYLASVNTGSRTRGAEPSLDVTGYGVARAPAEQAVIQLLIVRDVPYGSDGSAAAAGSGTPTPSGSRDRGSLAPVINAIAGAGINEADIRVVTSPSLISVCTSYSRCSSARIDVTVAKPQLDRLNAIVNAAGKAAADAGMSVQDVGVGYSVADCRPLSRAAREIATADAQARAQEQAEVLGVTLGKLLVSSEAAPAEPRDETGCAVFPPGFGDSWWTPGSVGLTVPAFDPAAPPEASVTVQVTLVYAIEEPPHSTSG
jgi:uncharacterized protein YggE